MRRTPRIRRDWGSWGWWGSGASPVAMPLSFSAYGRGGSVAGGGYQILSRTMDAFGNWSWSLTKQELDTGMLLTHGQVKNAKTVSASVSVSIDGSVTVTDPYDTNYSYKTGSGQGGHYSNVTWASANGART